MWGLRIMVNLEAINMNLLRVGNMEDRDTIGIGNITEVRYS
jgi:hypothetical protein